MAKIFDISDFSAPELDVYARLTENQLVNRADPENRSEEHTSELQSLKRISYAVSLIGRAHV